MLLEKTPKSPLDSKGIKPVNPKENQPLIFFARTDADAEASILWLPDVKSWLIGKDPWSWERLKARGEEGDRGWDGWMASLTMDMSFSKHWKVVKDKETWYATVLGSENSQTWLSYWTTKASTRNLGNQVIQRHWTLTSNNYQSCPYPSVGLSPLYCTLPKLVGCLRCTISHPTILPSPLFVSSGNLNKFLKHLHIIKETA